MFCCTDRRLPSSPQQNTFFLLYSLRHGSSLDAQARCCNTARITSWLPVELRAPSERRHGAMPARKTPTNLRPAVLCFPFFLPLPNLVPGVAVSPVQLCYIRCAECTSQPHDVDLCAECFATGQEPINHKKTHKYRVMDKLSEKVFCGASNPIEMIRSSGSEGVRD